MPVRWPKRAFFSCLLQRNFLGQNELTKRSKHTRKPQSAQKRIFNACFGFGQDWQAGPWNGQNRQIETSPRLSCVVRLSLKLIWELFRASQSPHAIFSTNGHHTKVVVGSKIGNYGTFKKLAKIDFLEIFGHFRKIAKIADLRPLHVFCVLSV